jgi:hypothetical protein
VNSNEEYNINYTDAWLTVTVRSNLIQQLNTSGKQSIGFLTHRTACARLRRWMREGVFGPAAERGCDLLRAARPVPTCSAMSAGYLLISAGRPNAQKSMCLAGPHALTLDGSNLAKSNQYKRISKPTLPIQVSSHPNDKHNQQEGQLNTACVLHCLRELLQCGSS